MKEDWDFDEQAIIKILREEKEIVGKNKSIELIKIVYEDETKKNDGDKPIKIAPLTKREFEKIFPIVEASKLSLEDDFLVYQARTVNQSFLKKFLEDEIKNNKPYDFRKSCRDISYSNRTGIWSYKESYYPVRDCYKKYEWHEIFSGFKPEKNSRLMNKNEYYYFLGVLLKYLVNNRKMYKDMAWNLICDDSSDLGNFLDYERDMEILELAGSRPCGIWYDLANTHKILNNEKKNIVFASGAFDKDATENPLVKVTSEYQPNSTGIMVTDV